MKKLIYAILFFLIAISVSFCTYASSYNVKLNYSKSKDDKEVILTVVLENATDSDIDAFQTTLEYDNEVFETVQQEDIKCSNGWGELLYNPENGMLIIEKESNDISTDEVLQITFKVKENVNEETKIGIKDSAFSDGSEDIIIQDISEDVNLNVKQEDTKPEENPAPEDPEDSKEKNEVENIENNKKENSNPIVDNLANNKIPFAGLEISLLQIILLILIVIIIIVMIFMIAKKKINIKVIISLVVILIFVVILAGKSFANDGEINYIYINANKTKKDIIDKMPDMGEAEIYDGEDLVQDSRILATGMIVNYQDLQWKIVVKGDLFGYGILTKNDIVELKRHLIKLTHLKNEYYKAADINADGKVTITDLTLLKHLIDEDEKYTDDIEVENIELNQTNIKMVENASYQLVAKITPDNATDKTIIWQSSDESIVEVTSSGMITARKEGKAIVTVLGTNSKEAYCEVAVVKQIINIQEEDAKIDLSESNKIQLNTDIENIDENARITWSSSNEDVAVVDANGQVTGKSNGVAIITVETEYGQKDECTVTVQTSPASINLNTNNYIIQFNIDKTVQLVADLGTANVNTNLTWSSDDENIAVVDDSGLVTAKNLGDTLIRVRTENGKEAVCEIHVTLAEIKVNEIRLFDDTIRVDSSTILIGLNPLVLPYDATNKQLLWESDNTEVASIGNANGSIMINGIGTAHIKVSAQDGSNVSATYTIEVIKSEVPVESIALNESNIQLDLNGTSQTQLYATVTPDNATITDVFWESNNIEIATVDKNGLVTAKKDGKAIITAQTSNGKTATCEVTVITSDILVERIELTNTTIQQLDLNGTKTVQLSAKVYPENATNKQLAWKTSDESIAVVNEKGLVTATGVGTAEITIESCDGSNKSIKYSVQVIATPKQVQSISLNKSTVTIDMSLKLDSKKQQLTATVLPSDAANKTITWTSSDTSVATVNSTGEVTAIKEGTAVITAKSNNNKVATCKINVIRGLKIEASTSAFLQVNVKSKTLKAVFNSSTTETVKWSVNKSGIISLSATTGNEIKISRLGEGTAVVTAETPSGKEATYNAVVKQEKVIISGASSTTLMAGTRNDGDTGKPQKMNYGKLKLNDTLHFVACGGTGIYWYLNNTAREYLESTGLFSLKVDSKIENAGTEIERLLNNEDTKKVHCSVILRVEGNDLKKIKSLDIVTDQKEKLEITKKLIEQADTYANYYVELASKYPSHRFCVVGKGIYYSNDTRLIKNTVSNTNVKLFNQYLKEALENYVEAKGLSNLKFKNLYTYEASEAKTDSKMGITSDNHPNAYTSQKIYTKLLEYVNMSEYGP